MEFVNPFKDQPDPIVDIFGDEFDGMLHDNPERAIELLHGILGENMRLGNAGAIKEAHVAKALLNVYSFLTGERMRALGTEFSIDRGSVKIRNMPLVDQAGNDLAADMAAGVNTHANMLVAWRPTLTSLKDGSVAPTLETHIWIDGADELGREHTLSAMLRNEPETDQQDDRPLLLKVDRPAREAVIFEQQVVATLAEQLTLDMLRGMTSIPPIDRDMQRRLARDVSNALGFADEVRATGRCFFSNGHVQVLGLDEEQFRHLTGDPLPTEPIVLVGPQLLTAVATPSKRQGCYGSLQDCVNLEIGLMPVTQLIKEELTD